MKNRKLSFLVIFLCQFIFGKNYAQLVNNGETIQINNSTILYVDQSYIHNAGAIINDGELIITNDWLNNNYNSKVFDAASTGMVKFVNTFQKVGGVGTTKFPQLKFEGTGSVLLTGNIEASISLDLDNKEINLKNYSISLLNADVNSLLNKTGFINTNSGGVFFRKTSTTSSYIFPLGSSSDNIQRPVAIVPKEAKMNVFGVSLINKDASLDGYDRLSKRSDVAELNDKYYFKLYQTNGLSNADFSFYISTSDGDYNSISTWEGNKIWEKGAIVKVKDGLNLLPNLNRVITYTSMKPLNGIITPFNLAKVKGDASPLEIFNAFSPDGDGKNDKWEVKNIDAFPDNDVKIYDRSGNNIFKMSSYTAANAWDGQNVNSGTYFYVLRVKINGDDKFYKGSVTLVKN